jgi:hypothetical protein
MKNIMIDIETLGRKPGCVVLSVGAVEFGANGFASEFEANIDIRSTMSYGLTIEADTLLWWMARGLKELPCTTSLSEASGRFCDWFNSVQPACVWANSPSFDCEIWGHAIELVGHRRPWTYRQTRDMRTARELLPFSVDGDKIDFGEAHTALADAKWQAEYLIRAGLFAQ